MKYALVTFSRGSGSCHDEEIRLFRAKSKKVLDENIQRHYDKYYKTWSKYVEYIEKSDFELGDDGSIHVSSYYS